MSGINDGDVFYGTRLDLCYNLTLIILEPDNKFRNGQWLAEVSPLKINNGKSGPGRTYGWCSGSGRGQQEAAATIRRAGSSVGTGIKVSTIYYDSCNIKMKSISTM